MNIFNKTDRGDLTGLTSLEEFDNHPLVSYAFDKETGLSSVIAIHRSNPATPSFGATRLWQYESDIEGVKDALRLSRLMSYKAALAGLECGGAKGVILAKQRPNSMTEAERTQLIEAYAARVNILNGSFITGTDVGVRQEDLATMRQKSRHIIGHNGNSTEFTSIGVFESLKAALVEKFGSPDPSGRSFAIQGLGKVGGGLLALLYDAAGPSGKIYVSDLDNAQIAVMRERFPRIIPVSAQDLDSQEVDVFSPNALSGSIHSKNVAKIKAKIVVGGANNQLAGEALGDTLHERGILYVPDYVANAGGLIAVFDEYRNASYDKARVERAVAHIPETLKRIFAESREKNTAPARIANSMAERIFNGYSHAT